MPHSQADLNQSRSLPQASAQSRTGTQAAPPLVVCGAMRGRSQAGVTQVVTRLSEGRDAPVTQPAWTWLIWLDDKEAA
jgi:hypothetical protein